MATDFNRILQGAKKAIAANGRVFALVESVNGGDPWNPTITETQTSFIGVQTAFGVIEQQTGLVADGDIMILAAGDAFTTITTGQKIIDEDGTEYRVKRIAKQVKPASVNVLWKIHCER